jgi:phage gp29-like protein
MVSILGPDGQPISREVLGEPQTAQLMSLHQQFQGHPSRGLTPTRLAQILEAAEQGDLVAQYELFEDMEEKDGHIASEMGKRRLALTGLEWDIVPPPNASAKEKDNAKRLKEAVGEIADFDEAMFDLTDAIGKGFVALEYEWHRLEGVWLQKTITHRPQSWFRLHRSYRQEIRLADHTPEGAQLRQFGWLTHTHKCKSGYLERAGLFRVLVWPYLFKNYGVADLAEWLEIYGIPLRIGKYPSGAGDKEKMTLLRALVGIGHNAAGIMPAGMEVDFHETATGDAKAFELMIDWCERTESKVILGATLTSQADRGSNTNALGNIHNEIRKDLRDSDAKQVAAAITRDLLYPIAALNGWVDSLRRAPRFRFDTGENEDMEAFGGALPGLVRIGMRIDRQWAQERLGIPEPEEGADVLVATADAADATPPAPAPNEGKVKAARATRADIGAALPFPERVASMLETAAAAELQGWYERIAIAVEEETSFAALSQRLLVEFDTLPEGVLSELVGQALLTTHLGARAEVLDDLADAG